MKKLIPYLRVSTQRQGRSGLGLEAQIKAIQDYAARTGGEIIPPIDRYREVETGKKSDKDRPVLRAALAHCRQAKATLVIAKLDRLARNVAFVSALMDSGVDFVAIDCPEADRFTLHIFAALAEREARDISERTKKALAAKRARGEKLGNPANLKNQDLGRARGAEAARQAADVAYRDLLPLVTALRASGKTYAMIADHLNANGFVTRRGRAWNHVQVMRVVQRSTPKP